eukprot:694777-Ditylum_brightwellii.AAC.1
MARFPKSLVGWLHQTDLRYMEQVFANETEYMKEKNTYQGVYAEKAWNVHSCSTYHCWRGM